MPTFEVIDPSQLYCMFKGEPGTRKSTQALSFPKPQYWFNWDRKIEWAMLPMRAWGINPRELEYEDYDEWNKARIKLESFQVNCKYKTLVFDSLTSCADMTLRATKKLREGGKKPIGGIAVNDIEDYLAESAALQELIAITKDIKSYHKVNIILIAHVVQAEYRSIDGKTHFSRQIVTAGKKVAPKIPAYCGEVYHFNIKKSFEADKGGQYSLLTEHTGDDFARTALPLEREIVFGNEPLYQKWLEPAINKLKVNPQVVTKI